MKLGVNIRTIQRWWRLFKNGLSLENQGGRGRKSSVPKIAKIVITNSIGKKTAFCTQSFPGIEA